MRFFEISCEELPCPGNFMPCLQAQIPTAASSLLTYSLSKKETHDAKFLKEKPFKLTTHQEMQYSLRWASQ